VRGDVSSHKAAGSGGQSHRARSRGVRPCAGSALRQREGSVEARIDDDSRDSRRLPIQVPHDARASSHGDCGRGACFLNRTYGATRVFEIMSTGYAKNRSGGGTRIGHMCGVDTEKDWVDCLTTLHMCLGVLFDSILAGSTHCEDVMSAVYKRWIELEVRAVHYLIRHDLILFQVVSLSADAGPQWRVCQASIAARSERRRGS